MLARPPRLVGEWIAGDLPERVRVPQDAKLAHSRKHVLWRHRSAAAGHQRSKRNGEIAALVLDHGQAAEHVAEIHGVTAKRVRQIVASAAGVSEHTVKNCVFRVFNKLGVSTRVELALYALGQQRADLESNQKSA